MKTDIISRMEANQARFSEMPKAERDRRNKLAIEIALALHTETKSFPSLLVSAEDERRLQLCDREERTFDAEDAEEWQCRSEEQGTE